MGLLDGTLQQKIKRLEKLTSPSQYPKPSQDSIDKLRRNIRESASAPKGKKKDPEAPYSDNPTPGKPGWNLAKKKKTKKSKLKVA